MRRGPGAALLGLSLGLLAAAFDTPALYVPAVGLVLIALAAAGVTAVIRRTTRIERTPAHASVQEGETLAVTLSVRGPLLALAAAELAPWPGAAPAPLRRGSRRRIELRAQLPRRGRHVLGPSELRVGDPFGVSGRSLCSEPADVLVLPRIEPLPRAALAWVAGTGRWAHSGPGAPRGAAIETDALQPHRPGAPASRIHWPTVARTGRLHERRPRADADRHPLVVLDSSRAVSEAALDACVRAAASLCRGLAEHGGCSLLLGSEPRPLTLAADLRAWPALHTRLALAPAGVEPARDAVRGASVVLWVSAAAPAPAAPEPSLPRIDAELLTVSPFPRAERPVVFEIAGCVVQPARPRASRARAA